MSKIANISARQFVAANHQGSGDHLIIFVHGWSCSRLDWTGTLAALPSHIHAIAPDLPGHGDSADLAWNDWTITGLAGSVVALAKDLDARKLTLVGHSMGGTVALEAATMWDGVMDKVILVDTFGLPYGDMDAETIASIEEPFHQDFVAAMHALVDNTTTPDLDEKTRTDIKQHMASAHPDKMLPIWTDLLRWSPDSAFAQLQCPIYAINGEHISDPAQKRCAPFVQARVIPNAHHFPQFEQPDQFYQALNELL